MALAPLLYQTGYLTITDYNQTTNSYTLDFPNGEVRQAFSKSLVHHYAPSTRQVKDSLPLKIVNALIDGNIDNAMNTLHAFLAKIPHDIIEDKEKYYQTAVHLIFSMLGFHCHSELRTATGRIDALVETPLHVYCFEFKLGRSAQAAIRQIEDKDYLAPWRGSGKRLVKVGVGFDKRKRNVGKWVWEVVEHGAGAAGAGRGLGCAFS